MANEQRQPTAEDFGSTEEVENMIQRAMAQTGMSREQLEALGQRAVKYQKKKAAVDPQYGVVAGPQEIRRFVQKMGAQMDQNDMRAREQEAVGPQEAGPQAPQAMGPDPMAPPMVSPYADRDRPVPTTPSAAALGRLYEDRIGQLEKELDQERLNNINNAGAEAYAAGRERGEASAIESGSDIVEGSPANKARLVEAQNRRALAMGDLQKRLSKLNRRRG